MWEGLVGQERAIERLTLAAQRPSHAYLVVGPRGSGAETAARGLAALLVGGAADEGVAERVMRGVHPDVVEFEPGATQYSIKDDVRVRILPEASGAPIEASRKVLVLFEAERLRGTDNAPANALLKTLEEPPPRTVIILVTGLPGDLLPTIRSRCQRIDLDAVSGDDALEALRMDGTETADAVLAVTLSGGQLARARALAGPLARVRASFAVIPGLVDGAGSTAASLAAAADVAVEEAYVDVIDRHKAELAELDVRLEAEHYEGREAKRPRDAMAARHKREARRARMDLLLEGVTAIESVYRDALAGDASPLNGDRDRLDLSPRACMEALDLCRGAREAFLLNEKGTIQLEHLCMSLPAAPRIGAGPARR